MIAIEIVPVVEDRYYRIIIFDLEIDDSGHQVKFVREFYHSDNLLIATGLLHRLAVKGMLGPVAL